MTPGQVEEDVDKCLFCSVYWLALSKSALNLCPAGKGIDAGDE